MPSARAAFFALAALSFAPATARAQDVITEKPAATPSAPAPKAKPASAPAATPTKSATPAAPKSHPKSKSSSKKRHASRRPSATLPANATRPTPNDAARKHVAGGSVADSSKGADDPELRALHDADRVLFPKPLPGSSSGFSFGFPKPASSGSSTEVVASGLPPSITPSDPGLDNGAEDATDAEWIRSLTMPDLPVRLESRVIRYLKFYRDNPKGKAIAHVWARKSGRYVSMLKAELAKAGLPTDLVWLSLIESGHNPTIVSPAGAAGLWQFMPEAGRLYGLNVDRWVDERLNPKRETEAALLYLTDLRRRFGSWELAMAAYNMGYGGLAKAIRKFNTNDYWELCRYEAGIPWETTLYVPKIFAIAVVMTNKKAFGIDDVTPDPPESFDTALAPPGLSLDQVARAAGVSESTISSLNPEFLAGRVPPAKSSTPSYKVRVPAGKAGAVGAELAKLGDPEPDLEPYTVRLGDDAASIAAARGTDSRIIERVNHLSSGEVLARGTILLAPRRASAPMASDDKSDEIVVVSPREYRYPDRERVFYRVESGDTLSKIAEALAVEKSELEAWNSLDPAARLQSGMVLQVFVKFGARSERARVVKEKDARVLVAGTGEFFDYFEGLNGKKRIAVEARAGDTLATLGRRYGMSVGWMERVNRRSRKKELRAGEKLVVYVSADNALAKTGSAPDTELDPLPELDTSDAKPDVAGPTTSAAHPDTAPGG
jgi:peptidoglycan lytic transglycosylase D